MKYQRTFFWGILQKKLKYLLTPFIIICIIYISYQLVIFVQLSAIHTIHESSRVLGTYSEDEAEFYRSVSVVDRRQQGRDKKDETSAFRCILSGEQIPFSQVNDDYCDCADGTDEPGTSACPNGQFYCNGERRFLSSHHVNDGICDCCDGSDEYQPTRTHLFIQLDKATQRRLRRYLAPCDNVC